MLPWVTLSARDLGATSWKAAFVGSLIGIGQLFGDVAAEGLAARRTLLLYPLSYRGRAAYATGEFNRAPAR